MTRRPTNWTDHSCQCKKLVGERHRIRAVDCELPLAGHVHEFDAGEHGAGGVLGGRIDLASDDGQGTLVTVTLPVTVPTMARPKRVAAPNVDSLKRAEIG